MLAHRARELIWFRSAQLRLYGRSIAVPVVVAAVTVAAARFA